MKGGPPALEPAGPKTLDDLEGAEALRLGFPELLAGDQVRVSTSVSGAGGACTARKNQAQEDRREDEAHVSSGVERGGLPGSQMVPLGMGSRTGKWSRSSAG